MEYICIHLYSYERIKLGNKTGTVTRTIDLPATLNLEITLDLKKQKQHGILYVSVLLEI